MTVTMSLYDRVQAAAGVVRGRSALVPEIGIILGTGLGGLAREIAVEAEVPYAEIPGFPLSTVETHAGRLLLGRLGGRPIVRLPMSVAIRRSIYATYKHAIGETLTPMTQNTPVANCHSIRLRS